MPVWKEGRKDYRIIGRRTGMKRKRERERSEGSWEVRCGRKKGRGRQRDIEKRE